MSIIDQFKILPDRIIKDDDLPKIGLQLVDLTEIQFESLILQEFFQENRFKFPLKIDDFKDLGIFKTIDNYVYHGGWKHQKFSGKGILVTKDFIYEGLFDNNNMQGYGDDLFDFYSGEIKNNLPHGKGIYKWHNENRYEGNFDKGMLHGHGKMVWNDDSFYIGQWKKNKCNGQGKLHNEQMQDIQLNGEWQDHIYKDQQ